MNSYVTIQPHFASRQPLILYGVRLSYDNPDDFA